MSFLQMYNYPLVEFGFRDFLREPNDRLRDQHFGETLTVEDVIAPIVLPYRVKSGEYGRNWRIEALKDLGSTIVSDRNKFEIKLDVQRFGRDEVQVSTTDGYIVVEGKHEEKQDDHGYVSRQFMRRYPIPADVAANDIESRLSADGVLTITAQKKGAVNHKIIPMKHTGPERKDNKDQGQGSSSQDPGTSSQAQSSSSQEKKEDSKEVKKDSKKDSNLKKLLK